MQNIRVHERSRLSSRTMAKISVLSVIAFVLMFFQAPLAFLAPPFIKLDVSDVPAMIGAFAMGPLVGVAIELFKNILHILFEGTTTGGVGELSNFIVGSMFVASAALIYRRHHTYRGAFFGLCVGILVMSGLAVVSNYFVVFPLYAKLMIPMETIIGMGTAVNAHITDLWSFMVFAVVPFNLVKGLVIALVTMLLYKKVSPILHR